MSYNTENLNPFPNNSYFINKPNNTIKTNNNTLTFSNKIKNQEDNLITRIPTQNELEIKNKIILKKFCQYHLIIIILNIIYVIFFFISKSKLQYSDVTYFAHIGKNWNKGPIISVDESCNNSKLKNPNRLIQEIWPGTVTGCYCSTSIKIGSCPKKSYCNTITSKKFIEFKKWKGYSLCLDRIKKNYFDLDIVSDSTHCIGKTKSCGIIDSKNNYLCVDENSACPINYIKVFYDNSYLTNLTSSDIIINFSNQYSKNMTNATMLFSSNYPGNIIPIEFKTSTGIPCKNPYYENMNYPIYILDYYFMRNKCFEFSDGSDRFYYENNFFKIDEMSKEKYYIENEIYEVLKKLPKFDEKELKMDIDLYSKNYFGLNYVCLKDLKSGGLAEEFLKEVDSLIEIDEIIEGMTKDVIFKTLYLVIGFIIIFLIIGFTSKNKKSKNYNDVGYESIYFYSIFVIIHTILGIINLFLNFKILNSIGSKEKLSNILGDDRCVDGFTYDLFYKSINNLLNAKFYLIWMNIIIISNFILKIIFVFLAEKFLRNYTFKNI